MGCFHGDIPYFLNFPTESFIGPHWLSRNPNLKGVMHKCIPNRRYCSINSSIKTTTHPSYSANPHLNNKTTEQNARYLRAIQPQKEKKRNNAKPLPTPASNR